MNTNPVISIVAGEAITTPFLRVALNGSGKAVIAGAADHAVGHVLLPVTEADRPASVHLAFFGTPYAVAAGAITKGALVYPAASGKVSATATGGNAPIGFALEAASGNNSQIRVIYTTFTPGSQIFAAGIHTWAGGAATTDSISVTGLVATDVVICTLTARASTETLVMAVNDEANDQIDLTLSANGTNGTTKINYVVIRATA
jgi:hypothetical protein